MSSDVPYPRGLPRRASMVVHLEANGLEARFWIASEQLTIRALESYMDVSAKPGSRGRP
jgi:hypothetical protein